MGYLAVIDVFRWIGTNWNDVITLFTFITTIILGFYKIRDLRRERANIEIKDVAQANFLVAEKGSRQNCGETVFTLNIKLFNRGREPAYVTEATLALFELDETLNFENNITKLGHMFKRIRLDSREEKEVKLTAKKKEYKPDHEKVSGEVIFNTTTGKRKREVAFSRETKLN